MEKRQIARDLSPRVGTAIHLCPSWVLRPLLPTHFQKIGWYRRLPFRGLVDMRAATFYAILLVEASALAVPRLTVLQ